jgi:DNA-directed RNA polymerase subunit F
MIIDSKPITLTEVKKLAGDSDKEKEMRGFIGKFSKASPDKVEKLKEELAKLGIIKLSESDIVSVANFMPEDSIDLNKILPSLSLSQEEVDKILNVVKKY